MTQSNSTIGVVTVTYNSSGVLDDFLQSLESQRDVNIRLYVIDNASADNTLAKLGNWGALPHVEVVANSTNVGVAAANNQGIKLALSDGCDWVLLLNNDTVFAPDTIATLVADAESNKLDMVSPVIEATSPPGTVWYSGGTIQGWLGSKVEHENMGKSVATFPTELSQTSYAPTCCLLISPSVFSKTGLMDTIYFVYHDDVDFSIRAGRSGFKTWVTPNARLTHKASSLTGGEFSDFSVRWSSRNWVLLARLQSSKAQLGFFAVFLQAWATARLALRRDSLRVFLGRQRAFHEGWHVPIKGHRVEQLDGIFGRENA